MQEGNVPEGRALPAERIFLSDWSQIDLRFLVGYDILKKIPASFDAACTGKGECGLSDVEFGEDFILRANM